MSDDFESLYMGSFEGISPLVRLAIQYHEECDAFDLSLCPETKGFPTTAEERTLVTRNATQIFNELLIEANFLGFTKNEFRKVITNEGKNRI